ncbi:putative TIR domain, winged helix-turn-helix DNA-binding domain-containing protein [Medicago truncatula]|uniref:Putative TIR domain, winged helix-turn-helix DNA-binding domain-containing protein n=1 Tax=Medicago truncatula TaxID=3880 RepID=A0A396I479_MEDTR|nr:disease resistance protein RUN1-like [Medicago truncatula]XP_039689136.1 disease resistance protein RUN1-like [Medicago truncatula]RHN60436.1 putative TIR domain, winged helix-turn-helix DNA-binding domain-containing protein [Medicago truncatula]
MAMQLPSSSSSFSYRFTYQVFLSFRGSDTRNGFTGHLYKALTDKGIHTFIDDRELQSGDEIKPSLDNAIEESRIFIPVFSINYASSSFCLDELVHIIHCYKTKGRLVLPVFYGVDPTHIRNQTGSYGEHLTKHRKNFQNNKKNMERLHQWKLALTEAANLSGHHFSPGYEYKFIGKIVKYVNNKISRHPLHVATYPVGLQSRVQQVKSLLDKGSNGGVRMIGLYGIGGMGKSTLAKGIYNFIADQFECSCFLENVRENSASNQLKHLQEELLLKTLALKIKLGGVNDGIPHIKERLHTKKILLILDDVDNLEQLHALAGGRDWFGCGSKVIITTRNKHLLSNHEIEIMHEVEGMSTENALELLRWMAFKNYNVPSSYEEILNRAVAYASGLPLAIEVVGSNLFGKSIAECESTLDKYERIPHENIQKILKVSFDALDEEQQSVFLDIACLFKGCRLAEVEEILQSHYGYCIKSDIRELVDKSLIKCHLEVTLHDLLEVMGKEIVRKESPKKPEKRSRLWCRNDIVHILQENKGTSKIEMIYLNSRSTDPVIDWNGKAFKNMTNLKTLIIKNVSFSKDPKYLPSSLRVLKLNGCSSESLSSIICSKRFEDMKVLTLDECQYLTHIPNVSGLPNLEKFSFRLCDNLIAIHDSIGNLNKLEILNASGCIKLESFPPLWLPSLKELDLSFCERLKSFPELLCKMTNTKEIGMCITSTTELPFSFQNLSLSLQQCEMLRFPKHNEKMHSIMFSNVEELDFNPKYLPYECLQIFLKSCVNVKYLSLSDGNFKILPECLSECHLMRTLQLNFNEHLEEIRGFPPNLKYLEAFGCKSLSSSSRRMLLSQQLHEAGCTRFSFPNGTEGIRIPDWFEHQSRGQSISFWFRKKIPSINFIIILPDVEYMFDLNLFVNGYDCTPLEDQLDWLTYSGHTYLFEMNLEENVELCKIFHAINLESEMDKALLKNEWIYVEFSIQVSEYLNKRLRRADMGIHVLKEKNNTNEDVIFTNPYSRKRKFDEYVAASLSEFHPTLTDHRFVEVGVSETEILQQQHLALVSGMRNLVLTETIGKEQHG